MNQHNGLEAIRIHEGENNCVQVFGNILSSGKKKAAGLINDRDISFHTFFVLFPQIKSKGIVPFLNARSQNILKLCDKILQEKKISISQDPEKRAMLQSLLQWIIKSGGLVCTLSDDYEKIIDISASLLLKAFKDNSVLPHVVDIIFKRNSHGKNYHDLCWACFATESTEVLTLISSYLLSPNDEERKFAEQLLGVPLADSQENNKYEAYQKWLEENKEFLYFTGESNQYSSNPMAWQIDQSKKNVPDSNNDREGRK